MHKILFIFGTRPEAIKLAPVILEFQKRKQFEVRICVTGQHKQMLGQVLDFFKIKPDFDLKIMRKDQDLFSLTAEILIKLKRVLDKTRPKVIFIQGDTTTAFVAALAGFYYKIKVVHIEAGLRSSNKYYPFPEELNRVMVGDLADIHFAPTKYALKNLSRQGIRENIYIVGNTVIDALYLGLDLIKHNIDKYQEYFKFLDFNKRILLVTGHRRENFGTGFENICRALKEIAKKYIDSIELVYPVHLNPNVQRPVYRILGKIKNIHLIKPLSYPYLLHLMSKCYLILTDSGGIQEEAPSLGKPVLVLRDVTERIEGLQAGTVKLVGTDREKIIQATEQLLNNEKIYQKMKKSVNPYGHGQSAGQISRIFADIYNKL